MIFDSNFQQLIIIISISHLKNKKWKKFYHREK